MGKRHMLNYTYWMAQSVILSGRYYLFGSSSRATMPLPVSFLRDSCLSQASLAFQSITTKVQLRRGSCRKPSDTPKPITTQQTQTAQQNAGNCILPSSALIRQERTQLRALHVAWYLYGRYTIILMATDTAFTICAPTPTQNAPV